MFCCSHKKLFDLISPYIKLGNFMNHRFSRSCLMTLILFSNPPFEYPHIAKNLVMVDFKSNQSDKGGLIDHNVPLAYPPHEI